MKNQKAMKLAKSDSALTSTYHNQFVIIDIHTELNIQTNRNTKKTVKYATPTVDENNTIWTKQPKYRIERKCSTKIWK